VEISTSRRRPQNPSEINNLSGYLVMRVSFFNKFSFAAI
jgi:hypothetical protein